MNKKFISTCASATLLGVAFLAAAGGSAFFVTKGYELARMSPQEYANQIQTYHQTLRFMNNNKGKGLPDIAFPGMIVTFMLTSAGFAGVAGRALWDRRRSLTPS